MREQSDELNLFAKCASIRIFEEKHTATIDDKLMINARLVCLALELFCFKALFYVQN